MIGEGEETVRELLSGAPPESIEGLAYGNGKVIANARRPLIPDLDSIPFPAWDLGEVRRYRLAHTRHNPNLPLMTSRGCPFNCIFCGSAIIHMNRVRYRSPDNVVAEIDELYHRHGAREIHVWDDNFTLNSERATEISEKIAEKKFRGLLFAIVSGIKPDAGDEKLFRAMARAGFYWVCIAFETGDQEIMNRLGKKVNVSKVRDTVRAVKRAGIYATGFFMLGLPYDNRETMERTIDFACGLPINQAVFFITIPFPGTELYEIAKREGKFLYHKDGALWERGYFLGRACYEMPGFDAALLERMYRRAYRRFHLRPAQILRIVSGRLRRPIDLWYLVKKGLYVIFRGRQF